MSVELNSRINQVGPAHLSLLLAPHWLCCLCTCGSMLSCGLSMVSKAALVIGLSRQPAMGILLQTEREWQWKLEGKEQEVNSLNARLRQVASLSC